MTPIVLPTKILSPEVETPKYSTQDSAGLDLRVQGYHSIPPRATRVIPLGVSVSIPRGYVGYLCARSSLFKRTGLMVSNGIGIIDSDYRGELMVSLWNTTDNNVEIPRDTAICQLVVSPVAHVIVSLVDTLDTTQRGTGGFGSTG